MLADGLREPGRPSDALHGIGGEGRAVEVSGWLDGSVELGATADELPWARRLS